MNTQSWFTPTWASPPGVRAVMTTRAGGFSQPPFDGFNLGDHVGDDALTVARHRQHLAQTLGVTAVYLRQVHGTHVVHLHTSMASHPPPQADAAVSTTPGLACAILVADCLPVLLAHDRGLGVGAAHAGWRGLAGGVIENTVAALCQTIGCDPGSLVAWLGPCIGPRRFEVGEEVREAFCRVHATAATHFRAGPQPGKWLADLVGLARDRLRHSGVTRVSACGACTVEDVSRFFSFRRDGITGRMAALVWIA